MIGWPTLGDLSLACWARLRSGTRRSSGCGRTRGPGFALFLQFDRDIRTVICMTNAIIIVSLRVRQFCDLRCCVVDSVADETRGLITGFSRGGIVT